MKHIQVHVSTETLCGGRGDLRFLASFGTDARTQLIVVLWGGSATPPRSSSSANRRPACASSSVGRARCLVQSAKVLNFHRLTTHRAALEAASGPERTARAVHVA